MKIFLSLILVALLIKSIHAEDTQCSNVFSTGKDFEDRSAESAMKAYKSFQEALAVYNADSTQVLLICPYLKNSANLYSTAKEWTKSAIKKWQEATICEDANDRINALENIDGNKKWKLDLEKREQDMLNAYQSQGCQ